MKRIYAILFTLLLSWPVSAQFFMGISYDGAVPGGEFRNFINSASFMGLSAVGRVYVAKNKSVGMTIGWNRFLQTSDEPLYYEGNWYYEPHKRAAYLMPFLLNFHYYFDLSKKTKIYAGLNGGFYYIVQKFKLTDSNEKLLNNSLHLGAAPEIGFMQSWSSGLEGFFGVRYNYVLPRKDTISFSHWSFYIGLAVKTSYF
ncbi:MAG TPA: hypothetical protein EYP36_13370 [Calditrichaeota bacterium]|nr:hypothetical protein [Calditrichota bacterium]